MKIVAGNINYIDELIIITNKSYKYVVNSQLKLQHSQTYRKGK